MLSFSFRTDKEQYRTDLQLFQSIYSSRLRETSLAKVYWGLFWVFLASLVYFGLTIRDQFYGNSPVVFTLLLIGAFLPINWYLTQLWTKKFTDLMVADTLDVVSEKRVMIDETGLQLEASNSSYQVNWAGVGKVYLVGGTFIIFCESNFIMIPLARCEPRLEWKAVQSEFESLSGKSIELFQAPNRQPEDYAQRPV